MYAVIMAGGSGTRFWPKSRKHKPKQFLNITGKGPMVVETCDRLKGVAGEEESILVVGREHLMEVKSLFVGRRVHVLAEPVGRNTAPCMGLGAIYAQHLGCEASIAFLPADHFIADPSNFLKDLSTAATLAEEGGIVTLGIVPHRPETGYGYIKRDEQSVDVGDSRAYPVSSFVEKPDLERARSYLLSGKYYWNAGIFVAKPETILREIQEYLPDLHTGLLRLRKVLGTNSFENELEEVYPGLSSISFDYGVMEKTKKQVYVVPSQCGWSDVGSWASLYELRAADRDSRENLAVGETLLIDCEGSFVEGDGRRLVACLGLRNCLVVDTPDTVLVADLNQSQEIRKIVEQLKKKGKDALL